MGPLSTRRRMLAAVVGWPGVTVGPHRLGGVEFRYGGRELGHLHGDELLDIPFPRPVRDELVADGRVDPHPLMPESGWVSLRLLEPADIELAIMLLRRSYELAVAPGRRHAQTAGASGLAE